MKLTIAQNEWTDYLEANSDVNGENFSTVGYGESKPVANNEHAAGRKINRRKDVVIRPKFDMELIGALCAGMN